MARRTEEPPKITFVNKPDVGYILTTLYNIWAEENGYDERVVVRATLKEEYREEYEKRYGPLEQGSGGT